MNMDEIENCQTCAFLSVEDTCYNDNHLLKKVSEILSCDFWEKNPRSYRAFYNPLMKTCRRCYHDVLTTELIKEESGLYLCQSCNTKKLKGEFK